MSAAKHTRGPWIWQHWTDGQNTIAEHATLGTIANVWTSGAGVDIDKANARLIAAAPELLEALQPFAERNSSDEFITITVRTSDVARARAAIAKATGGAS